MHLLYVALTLIGGLFSSDLYSQKWNLVRNGGFESLVGVNCPTAYEMLDRAFVQNWQGTDSEILVKDCPQFGWDANIGSTPYTSTNFCELNNTTIPENKVYAGFYVKSGDRSEYVGGDLKSSLISNVTYTVTADVAVSKAYPNSFNDNPYKGVMKSFEWQFVGEPYKTAGASLFIPGHGNIETGELNDTWTNTYKIPRSTNTQDWFTFDYFQLKETPANPDTPYLNYTSAVGGNPYHPQGTPGTAHVAIGMPSASNPSLNYYKWHTVSHELPAGSFPTDKEYFVFGMFYDPEEGNYTVNNSASSPECTYNNWYPTCDTGGNPTCPYAGAQPECPGGGPVTCTLGGPPDPSDPIEPDMVFPLCPHASAHAYYFLDNVVLTCDPKITMDVQWKPPGSTWQDWVTYLEHNSTHVEQILCGTDIRLRGTQENVAAQDGHRWSVYAHEPGEVGSGDNSNKCNPNFNERRIYETDNNPWIGNGPFLLEELLSLKYRKGADYVQGSTLHVPGANGNYIVLYDDEQATIVNEGSCHRKADSTEAGANSPFLGKHYTFGIIPPQLGIEVEHTSPISNPPENDLIDQIDLEERGFNKSEPIEMMCGDDLQIVGTVENLNNNTVQWVFRTEPDLSSIPTFLNFTAPLNTPETRKISEIIGNNEIPRSGTGDAELEVGLSGSCQSGPIRTVRAAGDTRYFKLKMPPPEITGGGEINCKDLNSPDSGLVTAISKINQNHRSMGWQVTVHQFGSTNPLGISGTTSQIFNQADPNGLQEVTVQELLEVTNLDHLTLSDGDIIEIGFGDQCTHPIKSDLQYNTIQYNIVGKKIEMEVSNNKTCDGVKREENTVNLLSPPIFTLTGEGLTDEIDWVIYDPNDDPTNPQYITTKEHGVFNEFFITPPNATGQRPNGDRYHAIMIDMNKLFQIKNDNFNITDRNKVLVKGFAKNNGNCGAVAEKLVTVKIIKNPVDIYFPNAISANNDGINDRYTIGIGQPESGLIDGVNLRNIEFMVFDRWGGIQHQESRDSLSFGTTYYTEWYGKNQKTGEPNQSGVYVWMFKYDLGECKSLIEAKDVTVVR